MQFQIIFFVERLDSLIPHSVQSYMVVESLITTNKRNWTLMRTSNPRPRAREPNVQRNLTSICSQTAQTNLFCTKGISSQLSTSEDFSKHWLPRDEISVAKIRKSIGF